MKQAAVSRPARSAGVALLAVVIILATLLIIGVLHAMTIELDIKANDYYVEARRTELVALAGLYRAIAELQYDTWGVNEDQAFTLAVPRNLDGSTAVLGETAYFRTDGTPIDRAKAKWRRTVERIGEYNVLTDYRWVVRQGNGADEYVGITPEAYDPRSMNRIWQHAGAVYHDEFLPEAVDNYDGWELGLHVNRGDIFFEAMKPRSYRGDERGGQADVFGYTFWQSARTQPWDREWDYVDSRINGDSFYKIFRHELVYLDNGAWRSNAAGVWDQQAEDAGEPGAVAGEPRPKSQWLSFRTHLGNATFGGDYFDSRGGAVNINQVNNNYAFELFYAQRDENGDGVIQNSDPNGDGVAESDYIPFHYRDSKWIFLYNEAGTRKLGRYAVLVWPDCGTPNANYLLDLASADDAISNFAHRLETVHADYFRLLDLAYSPRGGFIGQDWLSAGGAANVIKSMRVIGQRTTRGNWNRLVAQRIADHVNEHGPITSRAEMNMLLRKDTFELPTITDPGLTPEQQRAKDATVIASMLSMHAYENLMGPHWETDRLILDSLGYNKNADGSVPDEMKQLEVEYDQYQADGIYARWTPTSYMAKGQGGSDTRKQVWNYLNHLRYYWGPDDAREGHYTPYSRLAVSDPSLVNTGSGANDEPKVSKSLFLAWIASLAPGRDADGWLGAYAFDATGGKDFSGTGVGSDHDYARQPTLADVQSGLVDSTTSFVTLGPQINEVGTLQSASLGPGNHVNTLLDDIRQSMTAKGCAAFDSIDGTPAGSTIVTPGDLLTLQAYHFVEFINHGVTGGHTGGKFDDGNMGRWTLLDGSDLERLYALNADGGIVGPGDILRDADTRVIALDAYMYKSGQPADPNWSIDNVLWPRSGHGFTRYNGAGLSPEPGTWPSDPPVVSRTYPHPRFVRYGYAANQAWTLGFGGKFSRENRRIYSQDLWGLGNTTDVPGTEDEARAMPGQYALILFNPATFNGSQIRSLVWGRRDPQAGTVAVKDFVRLPGPLADGWSCYDFVSNQHPKMWAKTGNVALEDNGLATPAWRGLKGGAAAPNRRAYNIVRAPRDETSSPPWLPDVVERTVDPLNMETDYQQAWHHGLNANSVFTFLPGAESYRPFHNTTLGYALIDAAGHGRTDKDPLSEPRWGVSGLYGTNWDDISLAPAHAQALHAWTVDHGEMAMSGWGRFTGTPLGFFPRPAFSAGANAHWIRPDVDRQPLSLPDSLLRTWRDLMNVAPAERYFMAGYLTAYGGYINQHVEILPFDSMDNNQDGQVDNLVGTPRWPAAPLYATAGTSVRGAGHYAADRAAIGRLNLNELVHPAAVWFAGLFTAHSFRERNVWNHIAAIGRKPLKGYTSWIGAQTRSSFSGRGAIGYRQSYDLKYPVAVWYENLFADADTQNSGNGTAGFQGQIEARAAGRMLYVGNSPVYTLYVTAQTLDVYELPLAEIKVHCTIERTWDGKLNFLDFRWIPSDVIK